MLISSKINKGRKASSLTIPIPADDDNHALWLVIDICENGEFEDGQYTRINMSDYPDKFEVFTNDHFETVPDLGIGAPNYGDSVTFTLDNDVLPGYEPGKTYYVRYKWIDELTGGTDWFGFKFCYDMVDLRPVKTTFGNNNTIPDEKYVSGEFKVDYLEGDVQVLRLSGDATLLKENVRNIPYNQSIQMIIYPDNHKLRLVNGSSSIEYTTPCMVGVLDIGVVIMVDNEITV